MPSGSTRALLVGAARADGLRPRTSGSARRGRASSKPSAVAGRGRLARASGRQLSTLADWPTPRLIRTELSAD
jgi:hypothetical protein